MLAPLTPPHVCGTQEGDGISPTAVREIALLRELRHEHVVRLAAVHINRSEPSLSLAFDYAEHDLYEIIWHHRDRLAGAASGACCASAACSLCGGAPATRCSVSRAGGAAPTCAHGCASAALLAAPCCFAAPPSPPPGPIDLYVVKSLMWQLLNGLSYLHQNWIIHRDLKVRCSQAGRPACTRSRVCSIAGHARCAAARRACMRAC